MRKKNHDRKKWGSRLFKSLLLVMLVFSFCTRGVAVQPLIAEASAAVQKKNKIIPLGGTSGRYLVDTGYNWWLKDKKMCIRDRYEAYVPDEAALEKQRHHHFEYSPLISVAAVSYTHLDVYKRQFLYGCGDRGKYEGSVHGGKQR